VRHRCQYWCQYRLRYRCEHRCQHWCQYRCHHDTHDTCGIGVIGVRIGVSIHNVRATLMTLILRTLGGALGRRGAMTISSLQSCILCVISNMWNADLIHSKESCRSIYRCPSQPCLMNENHGTVATRRMSRKCSEDAGGRPREKRRHNHFITQIMHPARQIARVKC
jgi:hypothetical protein